MILRARPTACGPVPTPPIGAAYVAAALREAGHEVRLVDGAGEAIDRAVPVDSPVGPLEQIGLSVDELVSYGAADRWLVDPPREGAFALAKALAEVHQAPRDDWTPPRRIVYVSCNPATLARDAGLLVHQAGYRCSAAGVVNMFPHTAHVESIAVFDRA